MIDLDKLRQVNRAATSVDLIHKVTCASADMPYADVTRNNFKRDSLAVDFICNTAPVPF